MYRFLWKNAEERPNNYRIRTIKLRGQVSQGILFPVSAFPDKAIWRITGDAPFEGTDVTEALGITKYEPPLPAGSNDIEGQFFDGVPKTDEERVQSETGMRLHAALLGRPYYITVKCDGSSMTIAQHNGVTKVASRNYRLAESDSSAYWRAAKTVGPNGKSLIDFVDEHPHLALQGELVGPGIQNNRLGCYAPMCLVFNIYDRNMGVRLSWPEMQEHAADWFYLVPLVEGPTEGFRYTPEELLAMAEGKYDGSGNEREGIVIRSADPYDQISFKAISNRFLLRGGE
jgi:RNA ligase (TIGR02306 family)